MAGHNHYMQHLDGYDRLEYEYEEEEEDADEDEGGDGGGGEEEEEDEDASDRNEPQFLSVPGVVANDGLSTSSQLINQSSENEDGQRQTGGGETSSSEGKVESQENATGGEWNRSEIEGLSCPICMEAWTNGGDHQICCLPCGHVYCMSCIKRWLQQRKSSGKCPQCNRKCTMRDVRVLYASRLVVADEELQKKVRFLEAKCASMEKKHADWYKKEVEWQKREIILQSQVHQLTERTNYLEGLLGDEESRLSGSFTANRGCQVQTIIGNNSVSEFGRQGCSGSFLLQKEFQLDGARFFDVDASSQILLIARRLSGLSGMHVLTKISLVAPHERENMQLPVNIKAVKDIRVSPNGRLALLASLGKKLSVLSTESNNTILTYDLPAPAWSCSWDPNNLYYIYAGLQNGMLLEFDMRRTMRPVESKIGLASNPIHTVHYLSPDSRLPSGVRSLLTASSVGLCQWNFGGAEERPSLVPESENQGVCISFAYCPASNDIVASFRPRVEMSSDISVSQASPTPATFEMGQGVQGAHVLYRRVGNRCYPKLGSTYANVNDIRLPRSAIIHRENHNPLFASGDEATFELVLQELPSLMTVQHLKSQKHPIRDVKYTRMFNSGLLGCLSEDMLQLFSDKVL